MDTKLEKFLLNLSFTFFLLNVVLFSWWGANSNIEYVLPTFCLSFLAFLPLCFLREQRFYNNFERIIFFCGVYLISYALIGYFNPSKEFLKYVDYTYLKELSFIDYLPTSVKSPIIYGNALSSAMKIASVFFVVMVATKLFRRQKYIIFAMHFLAINGTLVAMFGISQSYNKAELLYNKFLADSDFYATFFLSSAASAFINLSLAINIALIYYNAKNKHFIRLIIFIICAVFCIQSVHLSHSDGAIFISYLTVSAAIIIAIFKALNNVMRPRNSILVTIAYLSFIGLTFLFTTSISHLERARDTSFNSRLQIYDASLELFEQNAKFGIGGECSRYLLPSKSYEISSQKGNKSSAFPARAHMDILEYFIEFGYLGAWVIIFALLAYVFKYFSKVKYLSPENAILFTGVLFCVAHSMWDLVLHFQSVMIYMGIVAILSINRIGRAE